MPRPNRVCPAGDVFHVLNRSVARPGWHWQPALSGCQWEAEPDVASRNLTEPGSTLAAIDYLHEKAVRRKLPTRAIEWRLSSAKFYINHPDQRYNPPPPITPLPAEFFGST